jgi:HSP20 family molecular chaperone IbpA
MFSRSDVLHHSASTRPDNDLWSRKSRPDQSHDYVTSPKADLRETTNMYYLEVELPGIGGPRDIEIHWLDESTLQIKATIHKTNLEAVWCDDKPQQQAIQAGGTDNKVDEMISSKENILGQRRGRQGSHVASTMKFWLNERRTGVFMRNVCFAVAVDIDSVQARLSEGLLMIMVLKGDAAALEAKEIFIKSA